jgi:hypothetical protein
MAVPNARFSCLFLSGGRVEAPFIFDAINLSIVPAAAAASQIRGFDSLGFSEDMEFRRPIHLLRVFGCHTKETPDVDVFVSIQFESR